MRDEDRRLLSNLLDSFDRLFDGHSGIVDVQSLLLATAAALPDSPLRPSIACASVALLEIARLGASCSADEKRALALESTQSLRLELAAIL